jgi:large subunit ribosomal protein L19
MAKEAFIKISPVNMKARKELDMRAGDSVRVSIKVEEKGKTRLQNFEGTVLARKGGTQPGATFTVRRVSGGYGVEKIFPLYAPTIDKIEVVRRVKTRRAKLYHIREKAAREIRRQMRKMHAVNYTTVVNEPEPTAAETTEAPTEVQAEA